MKRLELRPMCGIAIAIGFLAFSSLIARGDDRPQVVPSSGSVASGTPERLTREQAHTRLRELREQVERLESQGHKEEARELAEQAEQLALNIQTVQRGQKSGAERLTRDQAQTRLSEMHKQIERLRDQGNQEEAQEIAEKAEQLERMLDAAEGDQHRGGKPVTMEEAQAHLRELQAEAQRLQA